MPNLDRFFSPRSIAVIGASQGAEKIGGRLLRTLIKHGYQGELVAVNPAASEIAGKRCYAKVAEIPFAPDVAMIAVPAVQVPDALQACADKGIAFASIVSSGFGEAGENGTALQQRLKEICARTSIRVAGPNTEGYYNVADKVAATFNSAISATGAMTDAGVGDLQNIPQIGVVSQSGGLAFAFFNKGRRDDLVFSHVVSVGNQVDLQLADYLAWVIEQSRTRVLMMYAESINDPPRFMAAARRAADLGKPIVMVKVGNSSAGQRAAQSHTGAMASPTAVVNAALAQHGIVRADDQDGLLNLAAAFVFNPLPNGNRVGVVSVSGGVATWLADICESAGLQVPELAPEIRARIAAHIPAFGSSNNPVDITAQASDGMTVAMQAVGEAPNIDMLILALNLATERRLLKDGEKIAELARQLKAAGKPVLIYSYAAPSRKSLDMLRGWGLYCYSSLQGTAQSARALAEYAGFQRGRAQRLAPLREAGMPDTARLLLATPEKVLCEYEAKALLAAYGIAVAEEALARTADEAVTHAQRLGFPVALKVQSPQIAHKTEARAIALNLNDANAIRGAFQQVSANALKHTPDAVIHGVLVQKMARPGVQMIAGVVNGEFGPMVMVGLGGIYAEVLDDSTLAPAPITQAVAHDMLARLRGRKLLDGVRGEPRRDIEALADFLVKLSHLAWDVRDTLAEFDVNPVFVHEHGRGISIVDALAVKI
jgi:acetyltransferase